MTRFHPRSSFSPRSPGARLSALRRALWEEDRAKECERLLWLREWNENAAALAWHDANEAVFAAEQARMEAERELWEARAGHGLD